MEMIETDLLPMPPLADDVLLLIAENVSRPQLATLCRVSKKFKELFMPRLYQEARLQNADWKTCLAFFERLSAQQNMVRRLYVGRDIQVRHPMPKTVFEDILHVIEACLHKQKQLRVIYFNHSGALGSLLSKPDGQRVLDLLAGFDTLQEVSIINNEGSPEYFENRIPPFRNLLKLELLRMNHGPHDRYREVAEVLISCPHIRELALSTAGWAMQDDIELLPKLVQHYRSETNERLHLRSLRLGYGFLPIKSPSEYLSQLTDTALLETLRLDNENVGVATVVLDAPIDIKQFTSANKIKSFTAERLSTDIVDLIRQLNSSGRLTTLSLPRYCDTQPRARMDEDNEYWEDDWYGEDTEGPPVWDPAQMFSEPLEQAGRHWKNFSIGDIFRTEKLDGSILDCIATYSHIEVLTLPLPEELWPRFRDEIMPGLRHLQQLFLVGGRNAGSYGYQGLVLEYSHILNKTQQEIDELVKQRDKDHTDHLAMFARDVFCANRSRIAKGDDCAMFRYLGLGSFLYTCMLLPATASCGLAPFTVKKDGESWHYHVVLLDSDEASAFDSIRQYNEEIAELRVGGDQNAPVW